MDLLKLSSTWFWRWAFWMPALLLTPGPVSANPDPELTLATPGAEAAKAYGLVAHSQEHACTAFVEQIRRSSADPWAYRGAAICASLGPQTRETLLEVLDEKSTDSPLVLFARAYLHYRDEELELAEPLLRHLVDEWPDFVLAWHTLGTLVTDRGDSISAIPLSRRALELAPQFELARLNLERAQLFSGVYERLRTELERLPYRWGDWGEPSIPVSGRSVETVLASASVAEKKAAELFTWDLAFTRPDERVSKTATWLERRRLTELDLLAPGYLIRHEMERDRDPQLTALICEAWISLAENLGRPDVILYSASTAIEILSPRIESKELLRILSLWEGLLSPKDSERGMAAMKLAYADELFKQRDYGEALSQYREVFNLTLIAGGALIRASALKGEADVLFRLGDLRDARGLYQEALEIYQALDAQLGQGNALKGIAQILLRQGDYRQALSCYRQAGELFRSVESLRGQGNVLSGEAEILFRLGETQEALAAFREAYRLFERKGDLVGQADALRGEADIWVRQGRLDRALSIYQEVRDLSQAGGSPFGEGKSWQGEGSVHLRLGDLDEALEAYRKARELFRIAGSRLELANILAAEARVLELKTEYESSLALYREANRVYGDVDSLIGKANALKGQGEIFAIFGDLDRAKSFYRASGELFREMGSQLNLDSSLLGEADVLFRLGHHRDALETYRRAHQAFGTADAPLGLGNSLHGMANIMEAAGEESEALRLLGEARELFRVAEDRAGVGNTFFEEASLLARKGANERAAQALDTALEIFRDLRLTPNEIIALLLESSLQRDLGDSEAVIQVLEKTIDLYSQWRQGFIFDDHRTRLDTVLGLAYELLIPTLSRRGDRPNETLERIEESRNRVLLDLLASGHGLDTANVPEDLKKSRRHYHAVLASIGSKLKSATSLAERAQLLRERDITDLELQRNLYERLSAALRNADSSQQVFATPLDSAALQALTAEIGPVVYYQVTASSLIVALLTPSPNRVHLSAFDRRRVELHDDVTDFVYRLSNPAFERQAREQAESLWEALVKPIAEFLPETGPVVFVPNGPLHGLPFEALVDPETGERLFERWDVTVIPSASALAFARERHRPASADDTLIAFAAGVGLYLPREDVSAVAGFFPASRQRIFAPEAAEFRFYEEQASRADHLLIATHGVHTQASRRGTYLEIRPTPGMHDSRLTAAEIANIPIEAELVTLAACDTDRDDALLSDERLTLTRSFLIAGAASVLATRWRLPEDRSATRFLVDFYREYREGGKGGGGLRKDQALSKARRLAIQRGDPARVWAAWVLVGDGR